MRDALQFRRASVDHDHRIEVGERLFAAEQAFLQRVVTERYQGVDRATIDAIHHRVRVAESNLAGAGSVGRLLFLDEQIVRRTAHDHDAGCIRTE